MENNSFYFGIDYGTSQSTVSFYDPFTRQSVVVQTKGGQSIFPSVLAFEFTGEADTKKRSILFGTDAKNKLPPTIVFKDVKRFLGKKTTDIPRNIREFYSGYLSEDKQHNCIFEMYDDELHQTVEFRPEELIAIQLSFLKKRMMEECKNYDKSKILATHPSSYSMEQVELLKYAYKLAGINVYDMMKEPSAALVEYRRLTNNNVKSAVIIDIGAGTTDVCCCEYNAQNNEFVVTSQKGNPMLGGSDLDMVVYDMILDELIENELVNKKDYKSKPKTLSKKQHAEQEKRKQKLRTMAESIKIYLSNNEEWNVDLDILEIESEEEISITKENFENKIKNDTSFLESLRETINDAVKDSGKNAKDYEVVLLVGGSTYIPIIRQTIEKIFGKERLFARNDYDPILAVSKGASIYSFENKDNLSNQIETIPYPIGIDVTRSTTRNQVGLEILIEKGKKTPTSAHQKFSTNVDDQDHVDFNVYKQVGEYSKEFIGGFTISNIPKKPAGQVSFVFNIDVAKSGDVKFSAKETGNNGQTKELTVEGTFIPTSEKLTRNQMKLKSFFPK